MKTFGKFFVKYFLMLIPVIVGLSILSEWHHANSYEKRLTNIREHLDFESQVISHNVNMRFRILTLALGLIAHDVSHNLQENNFEEIEISLSKLIEEPSNLSLIRIIDNDANLLVKMESKSDGVKVYKQDEFDSVYDIIDDDFIQNLQSADSDEWVISNLMTCEDCAKVGHHCEITIIRLGTPLFLDGKRYGSILVNYQANALLPDMNFFGKGLFFIDHSGIWLEENYKDRHLNIKMDDFKDRFPQIWESFEDGSDDLITRDDGIFAIRKLDIFNDIKVRGTRPEISSVVRFTEEGLENRSAAFRKDRIIYISAIFFICLMISAMLSLVKTKTLKSSKVILEKELRYRNLFDNTHNGLAMLQIVYDEYKNPIDARFVEVNKAFGVQLGLPGLDFNNSTVLDIFPGSTSTFPQTFESIVKGGTPLHREIFSTDLDRYLEVTVYRASEDTVVLLLSNITARQNQKMLMKRKNEELSGIFESSGTGLVLTDASGVIEDVNPAFELMLGYRKDELAGKRYLDLVSEMYRHEVEGRIKMLKEKVEIEPVKCSLESKDGREHIYEVHKNIILDPETKEIRNLIIDLNDITTREQLIEYAETSREQYQFLSDNTREAVFVCKDKKIINANARFFKMVRLPDDAIENGVYISDVLSDSDIANCRDKSVIVKLHEATESPITVEVTSIQRNWHNSVVEAFVMRDVSAQKETEEKLEQARISAEESDRAKSEFLATISHELLTPMNGIIGMTQLLKMQELSDEDMEYVSIIEDSSNSLLSIVNGVLDLASIENGKLKLKVEPFNLAGTIDRAIDLLMPVADQKGTLLTKEIDSRIPQILMGDSKRIFQVLNNLVENAIKFTNEGSVSVSVKLENLSETQACISIAVSDTGIGIPTDKFTLIFERFTQVDQTFSRNHGGTGVGLHIAQQFVELMDGTIKCESELGKGSVFTVRIPLGLKS